MAEKESDENVYKVINVVSNCATGAISGAILGRNPASAIGGCAAGATFAAVVNYSGIPVNQATVIATNSMTGAAIFGLFTKSLPFVSNPNVKSAATLGGILGGGVGYFSTEANNVIDKLLNQANESLGHNPNQNLPRKNSSEQQRK